MTSKAGDDVILGEEELRHGVRRPWLGPHRPLLRRVAGPVVDFTQVEVSSGLVLVAAAVVALVWANSPWQGTYDQLWTTGLDIHLAGLTLEGDLRHWVNDGLMVLFFFVVGLEIKTELVSGELADARRAALPGAMALAGMALPAAVYLAVNLPGGSAEGWGVPMATDIAFALGVLALLGDRVPPALKVLLLAIAVVDDIGAVLVIALFYTSDLSVPWLAVGVAALAAVAVLQRLHVWYIPVYVVLGFVVWLGVYESGVHATIAGVALGVLTPARPLLSREQAERAADHQDQADPRLAAFVERESVPVADRLAEQLHPWTSYVVIPVFALANAGLAVQSGLVADAATSPITWGVLAGLLVGKPLGMLGAAWLVTRLGLTSLPSGASWRQVAGVATVAGIGFTMALFIAGLAFDQGGETYAQAMIGIFVASLIAAVAGVVLLRVTTGPDEGEKDGDAGDDR